ncbi:MAG: DinB family protein [Acidobacteriota bacterium]
MPQRPTLAEVLDRHDQIAARVGDTIVSIPDAAWRQPIAEDAWSPETIVDHLISTYEVVIRELHGGEGMRPVFPWWKRRLLRLMFLPQLLRGGGFPRRGVRAPTETRPAERSFAPSEGRRQFLDAADATSEAARLAGPEQRLAHAYFGSGSLRDGVMLLTRHLEHHEAQLQAVVERSGSETVSGGNGAAG